MRSVLLALSVVTAVAAQQTAWGQCGGINWSGPTTCVSGFTCTFNGDYYSQCIPGQAPAPTTRSTSTRLSTTSAAPTTTPSGIVTITSSKSPSTTPTTTSPSVPAGTGPGTVLQSGYYWIRAVEAPNFHKYLQTSPTYSTGTAILDSYTTAGQFQVVSGQLVELITPTTFLYANVIPDSTAGANKLAVVFSATKNTYGTFAWSGDALQWSVAGLSRPNLSAWLVCGQQSLWINLGSYSYMTPAGCADETIHFYNDKTANS